MNLRYKPQVIKQLKKLPLNERKKIVNKLVLLQSDPKSGKFLRGSLKGFYSLKVWPYRIIYKLKPPSIIVFSIAHRQSVYK